MFVSMRGHMGIYGSRLEVEVGWIVSISLNIYIWKQSFNLKLLALARLVGQ